MQLEVKTMQLEEPTNRLLKSWGGETTVKGLLKQQQELIELLRQYQQLFATVTLKKQKDQPEPHVVECRKQVEEAYHWAKEELATVQQEATDLRLRNAALTEENGTLRSQLADSELKCEETTRKLVEATEIPSMPTGNLRVENRRLHDALQRQLRENQALNRKVQEKEALLKTTEQSFAELAETERNTRILLRQSMSTLQSFAKQLR